MTLEQFRTKWGLVFSSLIICELITRIDHDLNKPLVTISNELADDLRKLLSGNEKPAPDVISTGFARRLERLDLNNKDKESER
jgi:hypothetical protein